MTKHIAPLIVLCASIAQAEDSVRVYPAAISLTGQRDSQSFVVRRERQDGITNDLTKGVEARIVDPQVARVEGARVSPVGDGQTTLEITVAGKTETVPIVVEQASVDPPLSFRRDVMPILTKAGCNSGRCHGAARGKDGFQLSLYGFDPAGDHFRLTRQVGGRRINLSRPEASLLMTKATGDAPHTGGERFSADSPFYATLQRWLVEGAEDDPGAVPAPIGIEIMPPEAVFNGAGEQQQLVVRAAYSDGTTRDVTELSTFMTNNENSAEVSESGLVTAGARGEAFVMARFATFTEGVPMITLPEDLAYEPVEIVAFNYIDELVHEKLRKLRITPSDVCTDEQFLRRVFLDLNGIHSQSRGV